MPSGAFTSLDLTSHRATASRRTSPSRRDLLALVGAAGITGLTAACAGPAAPGAAATTRTVTGAFGDVEVPADPQRIVSMYATDTDMLLVLGMTPVAAYATSTGGPFPPYQAARLEGVQSIATFPPDVEAIAAIGPDLILHPSASYGGREEHDVLADVAPVLSLPAELSDGADWREQLRAVAVALDRSPLVDAFVDEYDARAADLRARVVERWGGATFAYVGPIDSGVFYVAQANMQTNLTLSEDLGLTLADVVPATVETRRTDISYEEVGLLADVDILLLRVNPVDGGVEPDLTQSAELTGSPLWATLPAVLAGDVFTIDGDLFYTSPLTATANLDWAEQNLL